MPCLPEVDFTNAETIHSSVKYPPLKPNGRTIGSRSKPQLVFEIVIAFIGALRTESANAPFGATIAPATIALAFMNSLLSILSFLSLSFHVLNAETQSCRVAEFLGTAISHHL